MKQVIGSKLVGIFTYGRVVDFGMFCFVGDCTDGVCDKAVCHNGGTCRVDSPDQFLCLCPIGFYGPDCFQSKSNRV